MFHVATLQSQLQWNDTSTRLWYGNGSCARSETMPHTSAYGLTTMKNIQCELFNKEKLIHAFAEKKKIQVLSCSQSVLGSSSVWQGDAKQIDRNVFSTKLFLTELKHTWRHCSNEAQVVDGTEQHLRPDSLVTFTMGWVQECVCESGKAGRPNDLGSRISRTGVNYSHYSTP